MQPQPGMVSPAGQPLLQQQPVGPPPTYYQPYSPVPISVAAPAPSGPVQNNTTTQVSHTVRLILCNKNSSAQFLDRLGRPRGGGEGLKGRFSAEITFKGCPLFDFVNPAFPLPTKSSPTLPGAIKDGFGVSVTAHDMPEPCEFPSLDIWQKRFHHHRRQRRRRRCRRRHKHDRPYHFCWFYRICHLNKNPSRVWLAWSSQQKEGGARGAGRRIVIMS